MKRAFLCCILLLFAAVPAAAQQITVRSGEHENFSRLVFMYPAGTPWAIEPVENGYRLNTGSKDFRYALASVFRYIPKTRISSVRPDMATGSLMIDTAPGVHSLAFQLESGALVLDIVDGSEPVQAPVKPAEGSVFTPNMRDPYLGLYWGEGGARSGHPTALSSPASTSISDPILKPPDPRVRAAEADLLDQLGRAASQGLITLELPSRQAPTRESSGHASDAGATEPSTPTATADHLALKSETVIDRDAAASPGASSLSASGLACPPDREFDLQSWLTDAPAAEQIAEGRRDLLGEFDRPRREAIDKLAHTYVALGFGREARALYQAFNVHPEDGDPVIAIADLIEDRPLDSPSPLAGLTSCDGKVAMWALLAHPDVPAKEEMNFGAMLRAFSSLPPGIRELIGPRLSSKLIDLGASDVARTVRSMLARAPADHAIALDLIDANIDLSRGDLTRATDLLDAVAKSNSAEAADALVLSIDTKLSQGQAIGQDDVENASALSLQFAGTETGNHLKRAEILGRASTGQFEQAFAALRGWNAISGDTDINRTRDDLFGLLAKVPDNDLFLVTYFAERDLARNPNLPDKTQVALANRLSEHGFWRASAEILGNATRQTEEGHLALAQIALAAQDPSAAIAHLQGIAGATASRLRGEALSILGEHDFAQAEFARIGDVNETVSEAWRSGNWNVVTREGTALQKRFVDRFAGPDQISQSTNDGQANGPLSAARALIDQSMSDRKTFLEFMQSQQTLQDGP